MNMTLTPAERFREETRKETKIQPSLIDHITHDIVNQLSVISLCCCELRNSVEARIGSTKRLYKDRNRRPERRRYDPKA
jgi:hypothetical protein